MTTKKIPQEIQAQNEVHLEDFQHELEYGMSSGEGMQVEGKVAKKEKKRDFR